MCNLLRHRSLTSSSTEAVDDSKNDTMTGLPSIPDFPEPGGEIANLGGVEPRGLESVSMKSSTLICCRESTAVEAGRLLTIAQLGFAVYTTLFL